MSASKSPSRVIDGPYAGWETSDSDAQTILTNGSTLKLGQPMCIDVTQLGPDNNVPNNAAALPFSERVVNTTVNAKNPILGVISDVPGNQTGITFSVVNGVPTWTNTSGSTLTVTIKCRTSGFGYVYAGTAAIGQTGGNSILIGSQLIITTAQTYAIQGTFALGQSIGTALATAINTTETGAALGPGVISVSPKSMVGIVPGTILLIDTLQSGVQESVSVGSISMPQMSIALVNTHPSGFKITGPATLPTVGSVLISTVGAGVTYANLVACFLNCT